MALPTATPASPHNPQVVGAAFVGQYYLVLHSTPDLVYKFYQESSILSRPDPDGEMSQVTTLHDINEKILSFKFNSYIAEIETVDSLASYKEGVFIVVTGCLTSSDNTGRKFSQSFFLAPRDKGYFVLNDVFRFVDQSQPTESNQILDNGDSVDAPGDPLCAAAEPSLVQENHGIFASPGGVEALLAQGSSTCVNKRENHILRLMLSGMLPPTFSQLFFFFSYFVLFSLGLIWGLKA